MRSAILFVVAVTALEGLASAQGTLSREASAPKCWYWARWVAEAGLRRRPYSATSQVGGLRVRQDGWR